MSTFLITGGAGFIGSHLAEALIKLDQRVFVLDDLSSGSLKNLRSIRHNPNLEFVTERVDSHRILAEMVDAADVIFHLAATVGVFNIIESPVNTISNNIGGTEAVLQAAAKKQKKVIVASTSEVYGKSAAIPFREDGDLVFGSTSKSRWSYAASKVVDEFLALAYWHQFKVPTVVARFFNTIGPRQVGRYGMVVPRFMSQAMSGQPLTVYGNGQQSRCFTYISDIIEWLLLIAASDKVVGEVFNLGNPQEVSISNLARNVIEITGAKVDIEYIPYEKAYEKGFEDMERRVPDIRKIVSVTGYEPRIGLEQALSLIYRWLLQNNESKESRAFEYTGYQTVS
jgi:UDP-glucose 4-epimerase